MQNLAYTWDSTGNFEQRSDLNRSLTETFFYDALNRLDYSRLNGSTNLDLTYDLAGNIKTKSGVGTYTYGGLRPHAVTSLTFSSGGSTAFSYDANGNLLSGDGKTITWTSFRYPSQVQNTANNTFTSFRYGPDRQRYREAILANGTSVSVTDVIGQLYERIDENGIITHRHHVFAGAQAIAIHDRKSDTAHTVTTHYLHRDHLGSVDTVTDETGAATHLSFDAFGKRRNASSWSGSPPAADVDAARDITTRGYTGHQMLDDAELIHMGGRVYDPKLGRFLSPDPNIPNPADGQAFNRYAYVYNNPLSYTDPSGFIAQQNGSSSSTTSAFGSDDDCNDYTDCTPLPPTTVGEGEDGLLGRVPRSLEGFIREIYNSSFSNINDWGARGTSGSLGDAISGFSKTLGNTLIGIENSFTPYTGIQIDYEFTVDDNELLGAALFDGSLWLIGAVGSLEVNVAKGMATKGAMRATTDLIATRNGLVSVSETIKRIKAGGKFPHRNDGSVFMNKEGLLPKQPDGYYREYVHPTPGVSGPGAQRIIQGQSGDLYYSPDHYRTFIPLN